MGAVAGAVDAVVGGHAGDVAWVHVGEGFDPSVAVGVALGLCVVEELGSVGVVDGGGGFGLGEAFVHGFPGAGESGDGDAAVDVALREAWVLWSDAGEAFGSEGGGEALDHAFVGDADHADAVGGPMLLGDPVDDVGDVFAGAPGVDVGGAKGGAGAAHVDGDKVVGLMDELFGDGSDVVLGDDLSGFDADQGGFVARGGVSVVCADPGASVGGGVEDGGVGSGQGLAGAGGSEDVDGDAAAVVHVDVEGLSEAAVGGVGGGRGPSSQAGWGWVVGHGCLRLVRRGWVLATSIGRALRVGTALGRRLVVQRAMGGFHE